MNMFVYQENTVFFNPQDRKMMTHSRIKSKVNLTKKNVRLVTSNDIDS